MLITTYYGTATYATMTARPRSSVKEIVSHLHPIVTDFLKIE